MPVPSQVEEAAALAEQLHAQMYNQEVTEDTPPKEEPSVPDEPVEEVVEEEAEDPKWESRYKSLKGKYDKEVPRLASELRELKEDMFQRLQSVIEQKATATTPEQKEDAKESQDEMLSSFAETYGEDFTENLRKIIALEAKKLTGNVEEKVQSIEDTQFKTAQTNFTTYLDEQLKDTKIDWKACWQGEDPKFLEFLKEPDPSGLYTYADLAKLYNDAWDADKLAVIFKQYKQWNTSTQQEVVPPKPNPQKEAMVAPSRANTHTTPDITGKRIWTQDMISEFQIADRRGKYTPDESKAMWDDISAALGENRIR